MITSNVITTNLTRDNMQQIDVQLEWDAHGDEPVGYLSEDGKLVFPYEKCYAYDWKDTKGQARGRKLAAKGGGEVVILFDGSDSIIYANMNDIE